MENSKRRSMPMQDKLRLSKSQGASTPAELRHAKSYVDERVYKQSIFVLHLQKKFIYGLGVVPTIENPINMYCDNTGAIAIANEYGITKGYARQFRAKFTTSSVVKEYGMHSDNVETEKNGEGIKSISKSFAQSVKGDQESRQRRIGEEEKKRRRKRRRYRKEELGRRKDKKRDKEEKKKEGKEKERQEEDKMIKKEEEEGREKEKKEEEGRRKKKRKERRRKKKDRRRIIEQNG
ncbi:hypothetical protein Tco_0610328 [Tanacetum coccineum]